MKFECKCLFILNQSSYFLTIPCFKVSEIFFSSNSIWIGANKGFVYVNSNPYQTFSNLFQKQYVFFFSRDYRAIKTENHTFLFKCICLAFTKKICITPPIVIPIAKPLGWLRDGNHATNTPKIKPTTPATIPNLPI